MHSILHYMYHVNHSFALRKPNPSFDGDYYLEKYGDVRKSNLNPLVHYSLYGIQEGRKTSEDQSNIKNENRIRFRKRDVSELNLEDNKKISIKVPAPNWNEAHNWGDYHLALALKKEFEKKNYETGIQMSSEWYEEDDAGVVLALRGLIRYHPNL